MIKMSRYLILPALLLPVSLAAQTPPAPPDPPAHHMMMEEHHMMMDKDHMGPGARHGAMGQWWKNSDVAQKLKLTDQQIQQLDKKYLDHRLKLIDFQADTEKQDLKLQTLLDADNPDETQVGSQVDQVLAARGKLEREFTMMNLDLRKVLSVEQWRQLKELHKERGPGGPMFHPGHPGMTHPGMEHLAPSGARTPTPDPMPAPPSPGN